MRNRRSFDLILLSLRLVLGVIFIAHGAQKLFGIFGGHGIPGTISMMKSMNFILPVLFAWILALAEFLGGLGILLGALPKTSAILISIVMLVAIFAVHLPNGFFNSNGGVEFPLMNLVVAFAIFNAGAGKYSLYNNY